MEVSLYRLTLANWVHLFPTAFSLMYVDILKLITGGGLQAMEIDNCYKLGLSPLRVYC